MCKRRQKQVDSANVEGGILVDLIYGYYEGKKKRVTTATMRERRKKSNQQTGNEFKVSTVSI